MANDTFNNYKKGCSDNLSRSVMAVYGILHGITTQSAKQGSNTANTAGPLDDKNLLKKTKELVIELYTDIEAYQKCVK